MFNRRQESQLRTMAEQATEVRQEGKTKWNQAKQEEARGAHGAARILREQAREDRAQYERIHDEIDDRRKNPGRHSWWS